MELETGVGPFKEENVRLIRENSHLRMAAVRASEDYEDRVRGKDALLWQSIFLRGVGLIFTQFVFAGIRKRVGELEEEKVDLKQLVKQLSQRLEILTFEKSGRSKLEEKDQVHDFGKIYRLEFELNILNFCVKIVIFCILIILLKMIPENLY